MVVVLEFGRRLMREGWRLERKKRRHDWAGEKGRVYIWGGEADLIDCPGKKRRGETRHTLRSRSEYCGMIRTGCRSAIERD